MQQQDGLEPSRPVICVSSSASSRNLLFAAGSGSSQPTQFASDSVRTCSSGSVSPIHSGCDTRSQAALGCKIPDHLVHSAFHGFTRTISRQYNICSLRYLQDAVQELRRATYNFHRDYLKNGKLHVRILLLLLRHAPHHPCQPLASSSLSARSCRWVL